MTYKISKEFSFSASHQLHGLKEGHPCGRLHGHNYVIRVTVIGESVNEHGFVVDYNDLKPFGKWLDDNLDHKHLNDVLSFQPTAENMAEHMTHFATDLLDLPDDSYVSVAVSETPKTWASWE
jgi:6-pyruvoyltetrahydropterin/6-carboxytetrahydropterin synthase